MEIPAHIDALRSEGERMAAASERAEPGAPVPSCPEWTVRDLILHTGAVHRWATSYVATGKTDPSNAALDPAAGSAPADDALPDWLRQGCADLLDALEAAPDDLQCWTFLPAPSPRAMWARRQAHETAIHRVDAQQAAGVAPSPFTPAFAADGVDELLQLFVPRRGSRLRADPPVTMAVHCTDVDASWLLHLHTDGVRTTPMGTDGADAESDAGTGIGLDVDCTVRAPAGDLYLALWNRSGAEVLTVQGDRDVLHQFSAGVRIR